MIARRKHVAQKNGIEFKLTTEDISIPDVCPILKKPMRVGERHAPSLDRKNPVEGYIKSNCWVISRKANLMKNDASVEELQRFADWVNETYPR